jgi:tRNA modification GTPase
MIRKDSTICAPATPHGGALSIIRMSGPEAFGICEKIFFPADNTTRIQEQDGYRIVFGEIREGSEVIDEVLAGIFRAPRSYTGEDSVEFTCHGSSYVVSKILELLIMSGATTALPGEFTQRAFLNGKMDLSQAEAVADLVASGSKAAHKLAMNQMRGGFSAEIMRLRSGLLKFASLIEMELDFGEEDVQFADRYELRKIILDVKELSDNLASSFRLGNVIKNGIPVVIAGKPNSGKSTLLNALLNEEKAIVSDIPGTTRDAIEDTIIINGLEYRLIDTAGLRETNDVIENLGIRKTHEKIQQSSVVLLVDEVTEPVEGINGRADDIRKMISGTDARLMIIVNKLDQVPQEAADDLSKKIYTDIDESLLFISAKELTGLDRLKRVLGRVVDKERLNKEDVIISNLRHYEALQQVSGSMSRVISGLEQELPDDLIAVDIRQAIHYLGEITGQITTNEILGNIFKNFCIGK